MVLLMTTSIDSDIAREFVVWNVGQGQWVTMLDEQGCWHFDAGGEFAPWEQIARLCRSRKNHVWLSHWDWDHIGFIPRLRRTLQQSCLFEVPVGLASAKKTALLKDFALCRAYPFAQWEPPDRGKSNDRSRVTEVYSFLIPGDSTSAQEKIWIRKMMGLQTRTRVLILGHHGSRTSSSKLLLEELKYLRMAVSSSRFRRYGHPHREVESLLRSARVPLLTTEAWGNIHFQL